MRRLLSSLVLLFFLFGCGEEQRVIHAKTVQVLRVVCERVVKPIEYEERKIQEGMIVIEGIYKVDKEIFYHTNGNSYSIPKGYDCRAYPIQGEYACVSAKDLELLYPGPCKFKKVNPE